MIKDLAEDLIVIGLLGIVIYFLWKKYLSAGVMAYAAKLKTDTATVTAAIKSPADFVADLWKGRTEYISLEDFRKNIAVIDAQLKGKIK